MQQLKPVNVVIAGGGFVGLTMAKEITQRTSLSVVAIERGHPRKTADYAAGMDELDYALRFRMMQNLAEETATHRHSLKASAVPIRQYGSFNPGTGIGGAAEHWGAICYRYYPEVFTLASYFREKYGNARLPENSCVQDWGVTYDQLEPYYWRAEQLMGVVGKAGNLNGKHVDGGNVFEGTRSHEYPAAAAQDALHRNLVREGGARTGLSSLSGSDGHVEPELHQSRRRVARRPAQYCGYCTRYGCMIGAKAQPTNTLMPVLAKQKTFTLRTGCSVRRIVHKDGKAGGLTYIDANGVETLQPADVVIVASWTLNNARLLMLSKIGEPYDPATGKGTMGRNLTHQVSQSTRVFSDKPLNSFMGAGGLGIGISDFDGKEGIDTSSRRLPRRQYPHDERRRRRHRRLRRHSSRRGQVGLGIGMEEGGAGLA